ncbi:MAG: DNA primase [candidate division WOR-3 bacterium]
MIARTTIEQVRQHADIVKIVGDYVSLKPSGKYYRGICPFHPDRSPSFYVSPDRQAYHCFGCGDGGSVIDFVMRAEKTDFPSAVRLVAQRTGIDVQYEKTYSRHRDLYDACEFAAKFFERQLGRYPAAVSYLVQRGLRDETVKRFRLGYAPGGNELRTEARKCGIGDDLLLRAGLLAHRARGFRDWFFGRIVCPVLSTSGRVTGFSGRSIDNAEPKYLNSPDTDIFHKGASLFGIFQGKSYIREKTCILVEGSFDVLSLANRGVNNVVAPLGTAFTPEQALILRRYSQSVCILFDADAAGRAATQRAIDVALKAGLEPTIATLRNGKDPDELITTRGKDELVQTTEQAVDPVMFLFQTKCPKTVGEKNAALNAVLRMISHVPDQLLVELYLERAAACSGVSKEFLRARLVRQQLEKCASRTPTAEFVAVQARREDRILSLAIKNPEFARAAREYLPPDAFSDPTLKAIASKLYELCNARTLELSHFIEQLPEHEQRRRIAIWEFHTNDAPTREEFNQLLRDMRARWLCRSIREAEARGDEEAVNRLCNEYARFRSFKQGR